MKAGCWIVVLTALSLCITTRCGFAQSATNSDLNGTSSNKYFDEFIFLPGGLRQMAKTISTTNETFRLALKYIGEVRAGRRPSKLPDGLKLEDITNANYMIFDWPMTIPPRPVFFYGKVVDENGKPVAGATAHLEWDGTAINKNALALVDLPKISTNLTTDGDGLFSLLNKTGTELAVSVGKDGYYTSRRNRQSEYFKYSKPNLEAFYGFGEFYKPDSNNPVVFYLRKMGVGVDRLVTSQFGIREDFGVNIPRDGTPVSVDLLNRKAGNGQLEIWQTKPNYPAHGGIVENLNPSDRAKLLSATNWTFEMKIKDGGFVETDDEFAFNPPESGYQQAVHYSSTKAQTNWTTKLQKSYYIKLGNPPLYGHMQIETSSYQSAVTLWYVINPDGSRNLETKQNYSPSSSHWRH